MREKLSLLEVLAQDYSKYDPSDPKRDFDYWLVKFDFERISLFLKGRVICELGCSTGAMSLRIAKIAEKLVIVDGASYNLKIVREKLERTLGEETLRRVVFIQSLWEEFDGAEYRFSDIIFTRGLEHVEQPQELLKKIFRWMDERARLHIIVPNAYSLHRRIGVLMGLLRDVHNLNERDKEVGHKRVYDKRMLFSQVKDAGFKIIHWEGIFLKPLSNDQMKGWPENLIRAFYEIGKELPDYCAEIYVCLEKPKNSEG